MRGGGEGELAADRGFVHDGVVRHVMIFALATGLAMPTAGFAAAIDMDAGDTSAAVAKRAAPGLANAACGDANADSFVSATDASITLRVGVGSADCPACTCDVNRSGRVTATDGLLILKFSVGQSVQLDCRACATTTTTTTTVTTTSTTTTTLPCTPKNLSGRWTFSLTEISTTCPGGVDPPFTTTIVLAEDADGNVVITSPRLPKLTNLMAQRTACSAAVAYETPENNGSRFFNGTMFLGPAGDSFSGDLDWQLCVPVCGCGGVEHWQGTRLP